MTAASVYEIRRAIVRLECSACGAEANASCDCAKPYVPAMARAAKAIAANPEKSDRAIAAEIGVDHKTVGKARRETGGDDSPPDRIGQDGKKYPAKRTPRGFYNEPEPDEEATVEEHETSFWLRIQTARDLAEVPFQGETTSELVEAVRAVASAWNQLAQKLEGEHRG